MAEVGEGIEKGRQFAEAVAGPVSGGETTPAKAPPLPPPPPPPSGGTLEGNEAPPEAHDPGGGEEAQGEGYAASKSGFTEGPSISQQLLATQQGRSAAIPKSAPDPATEGSTETQDGSGGGGTQGTRGPETTQPGSGSSLPSGQQGGGEGSTGGQFSSGGTGFQKGLPLPGADYTAVLSGKPLNPGLTGQTGTPLGTGVTRQPDGSLATAGGQVLQFASRAEAMAWLQQNGLPIATSLTSFIQATVTRMGQGVQIFYHANASEAEGPQAKAQELFQQMTASARLLVNGGANQPTGFIPAGETTGMNRQELALYRARRGQGANNGDSSSEDGDEGYSLSSVLARGNARQQGDVPA